MDDPCIVVHIKDHDIKLNFAAAIRKTFSQCMATVDNPSDTVIVSMPINMSRKRLNADECLTFDQVEVFVKGYDSAIRHILGDSHKIWGEYIEMPFVICG